MTYGIVTTVDLPIPENVTEVTFFGNDVDTNISVPESVTKIHIAYGAYEPEKIIFPNSLNHLIIDHLTMPLLDLPISLQKIEIKYYLPKALEQSKIPFGCEVVHVTPVKN